MLLARDAKQTACYRDAYHNYYVLIFLASCPSSKPELQCPYNPCNYRKCINIPDATCVFDTCGQCKARFYVDDDNVEVTQQCGML